MDTTLTMTMAGLAAVVTMVVFATLRLLFVFRSIHQGSPLVLSSRHHEAVKMLVVLGSGGHTVEMLKMISSLDPRKYCPRVYVVADTDKISVDKLQQVEEKFNGKSGDETRNYSVEVVPRTREVRQSWITSVLTTIHALAVSFTALVRHRPSLILANGPGTCVPFCAGATVLRFLGVSDIRVVFVESLCRVKSLSLSGFLVYHMSDHFIVQWPQLAEKHPRAHYMGRLV